MNGSGPHLRCHHNSIGRSPTGRRPCPRAPLAASSPRRTNGPPCSLTTPLDRSPFPRKLFEQEGAHCNGPHSPKQCRFPRGKPPVERPILDVSTLRKRSLDAARTMTEGHVQHLSEMESLSIGGLRDLLATTKSVRDDESVLRRASDGREQDQVADLQRHVVVLPRLE